MTTDDERSEYLREHLAWLIHDEARRRNVPVAVVLGQSPADFAADVKAGVLRGEIRAVPEETP